MANTFSKITTQSIGFSYVADCSSLENRSAALLEAGTVIYVFTTVGPFVSRFFTRSEALMIGAVVSLLSLVAVYVIPESKIVPQPVVTPTTPTAPVTVTVSKGGSNYGSVPVASTPSGAAPPTPSTPSKPSSGGGMFVGLEFLWSSSGGQHRLLTMICLFSQVAIMGVGQIYYLYVTTEFGFNRQDTNMAAVRPDEPSANCFRGLLLLIDCSFALFVL